MRPKKTRMANFDNRCFFKKNYQSIKLNQSHSRQLINPENETHVYVIYCSPFIPTSLSIYFQFLSVFDSSLVNSGLKK